MALLQSATTLCDIELDRPASKPFYRQLCEGLREAILSGYLPEDIDNRKGSERLRQHDLIAPPLSFYATDPLDRGDLVFGYVAVDEARIQKGVARMEEALHPLLTFEALGERTQERGSDC